MPTSAPLITHNLSLEGPEALNRIPPMLRILGIAVALYSLGWMIAAFSGVGDAYFRSPAFVAGAAGVAWVVVSFAIRGRRVDGLYGQALAAFTQPPELIVPEINRLFARVCDSRRLAAASLALGLVFSVAAWFAVWLPSPEWLPFRLNSLRPIWFAEDLYPVGGGWPAFAVIELFALLIGFAMGTGAMLIAGEFAILRYFATLSVPPLPEAVRSAFGRSPICTRASRVTGLSAPYYYFCCSSRTSTSSPSAWLPHLGSSG